MPTSEITRCIITLILLLIAFPASSSSQSKAKYWVYFIDKGPMLPASGTLSKSSYAYTQALQYVQSRAIARRAKVLSPNSLIDAGDLPLNEPYIRRVQVLGGVLSQKIRWMNAASFVLTPEQVKTVARLPFVTKVEKVVVLSRRDEELSNDQEVPSFWKPVSLDYGPSLTQLQLINIPALHDAGISGHDVLVGMLDSGFRWRAHEALQSRSVVAEHDFIFNDDTTANQAGDTPSQDAHGTLTMSTLGGYKPGQLIGPAFDAEFILGKTEYIPTETRIEEDNWAAGIEWMESQGADVVSSSLGYNVFDPPDSGYSWDRGDFNGRTTVTAQAALRAARLGVVVCTAMGNEGNGDGVIGTMLTPADADSIVSVGAVTSSRTLASFSSTGPTNDGRTKPDVVTQGVSVYCAVVPGPATYSNVNGTSLATPLAAGSTALVLSARPELTPVQVRDALRNTATPITEPARFPQSPNNFTGWGLVNAFDAVLSFGPILSDEPTVSVVDSTSVVSMFVVSKFGVRTDSVILFYAIDTSPQFTPLTMQLDSAAFFSTSGRYTVTIPQLAVGTPVRFHVDAVDSAGNTYSSPAPIRNSLWTLRYGEPGVQSTPVTPVPPVLPQGYALHPNYPNPFNAGTFITFDLPRSEHVTIRVYSVLGQLVATLLDGNQTAGVADSRSPIVFDGIDLPSGVYFYRITTPSFTATRKMVLLR